MFLACICCQLQLLLLDKWVATMVSGHIKNIQPPFIWQEPLYVNLSSLVGTITGRITSKPPFCSHPKLQERDGYISGLHHQVPETKRMELRRGADVLCGGQSQRRCRPIICIAYAGQPNKLGPGGQGSVSAQANSSSPAKKQQETTTRNFNNWNVCYAFSLCRLENTNKNTN